MKKVVDFPHYSVSRLNMFNYCAHNAAYGYIQGKWSDRPSPALVAGKAVENAVNQGILMHNITKEELLNIIINSFQAEYNKNKKRLWLLDEEWDKFEDELNTWEEEERNKLLSLINYDIKKDNFPLIDLIYDKVLPILRKKVDALQVEFYINVNRHKMKNIIDFTFKEKDRLADLKTSGKSWPKGKELSNDQGFIYPMYLFKQYPDLQKVNFEFHIIVLTKSPKYEVRTVEVKRAQCFSFLEYISSKINIVEDMLERFNKKKEDDMKVFPGNRSSFFCSRSKCHVWKECEQNFGWRIKD